MPHHFELIGISERLAEEYLRSDTSPWFGSPFAWIPPLRPHSIGKIGERMFEEWCDGRGVEVRPSLTTQYDRVVNGHRMEVKFSTRWETGVYKFQQIRTEYEYDHLVCLGLSPATASLWVIPKPVAVENSRPQAAETSRWISFPADIPPDWMTAYGGSLDEAWAVIEALGEGGH